MWNGRPEDEITQDNSRHRQQKRLICEDDIGDMSDLRVRLESVLH